MEPITVTRKTLYSEVWETPMTILAKRYGISDVGLAKVCRKLNVPVPYRGYWAQIKVGQKAFKPQLPKHAGKAKQSAVIAPYILDVKARPAPAQPFGEEFFQRPIHIFAAAVLKERERVKKANRWDRDLIIHVADESLPRAISFLSAFAYALESQGHMAEVRETKWSQLVALIDGEAISFSIRSVYSTIAGKPLKLLFEIHGSLSKVKFQRVWSDTPTLSIEKRLMQIVSVLIQIAPAVEQERSAKERQDKIDAEKARDRATFLRQERQLKADLETFKEAVQLRELAAHIKTRCKTGDDSAEGKALVRWLDWVERMADAKDPAVKGVKELLKRYEIEF